MLEAAAGIDGELVEMGKEEATAEESGRGSNSSTQEREEAQPIKREREKEREREREREERVNEWKLLRI